MFTETHLDSNILDVEVRIPGYNLIRADRQKRKQGGACIYIEENLPFQTLSQWSNSVCELCAIKSLDTVLVCVYRPPDCKTQEYAELMAILKTILDANDSYDTILAGDFNFPSIKWVSPNQTSFIPVDGTLNSQSKKLVEVTEDCFLFQFIGESTRKGNILDLVFSNNENLIQNIVIRETYLSDHDIIEISSTRLLNHTRKKTPKAYDKFSALNLRSKKVRWGQIKKELKKINWKLVLTTLDDNHFQIFSEIVLKICAANAPLRVTRKRKTRFQKERRILWKKIKHLKDKGSKCLKLEKIRTKISNLEEKILTSFEDERTENEKRAIEKIKTDPKYFYKYANETVKAKSSIGPLQDDENQNKLTDSDDEIASILRRQIASSFSTPKEKFDIREFFADHDGHDQLRDITITEADIIQAAKELPNETSPGPDTWPSILLKNCIHELATPLKMILESSLNSGEIPVDLLNAHIVPIHKKGNRQLAENYRPISLTSLVSKIFEIIIRKHMLKFLKETNRIHDNQHGFREQRSCLSQLLEHHDLILDALESGGSYDVIYTDFAKAFDKCDFTVICRKLINLGIAGNVGRWIHSFLSRRKFRVLVNGRLSEDEAVISSVPQGTILAPLLFVIMINDISDGIDDCDVGTFADDTKISKCIKSYEDADCLQSGLNSTFDWADLNNMEFNGNKFLHLRYSIQSDPPYDVTYRTKEGTDIKKVKEVKDLGTIMSSSLSFQPDRERAVQKARQKIGWSLRTFKSRDETTIMTLYQSFVQTHVEYNSILTDPRLKKDIAQLERVQKSITSRISSLKTLNYWERLQALNILSLERRRERFVIIYTWRIIHSLAPNLRKNPIECLQDKRKGRMCKVPDVSKLQTKKMQSLREESFSTRGPKLFNVLPPTLRNFDNPKVSSFKHELDKFLKTIPDEPTIDDYKARNSDYSNSLLVWIPVQSRNLSRYCS